MAATKTGNVTHDNNMIAAEGTRQAAQVSGASQATVKAADIAWARSGLSSAKANGIQVGQFVSMLMELGTGGA